MSGVTTRLARRRLVFRQPVRTSRGEFGARDSLLLELRDVDGTRGLGEAAPWPGFGTCDLQATEHALRAALARLELADAGAVADGTVVADWRADRTELRAALEALLADHPTARAAVEGAICDLAARRTGVPLARWLAQRVGSGGRAAIERVATGALLLGATPEVVREQALQARAHGYRAVKLKLGGVPLADDLARVRAARAALGPGVRLRGDANGAWAPAEAAAALQALESFDVEYVEQPVAADDLEGLAGLRGRTAVQVAADESVAAAPGLRAVIDSRAADLVVLKPALLGGPLRALELASQARAAGMKVVFTHALDSAVGAWHAVHCAAAWADAAAVHGLGTAGLFADDVGPSVEVAAGFVTVSARPGLGFDAWT